jgi:predicted pyridoxine 5'-phosphate oxidase superfamily flavin-nucleotide-binding protein
MPSGDGIGLVTFFFNNPHYPNSLMITNDVLQLSKSSVLCWLGTVDPMGVPNVSPKEIWTIFDQEHLVIANIASPASARNIEANPLVCVSFVDILTQKGYKISGSARNVRRPDPEFSTWSEPLERMAGSRFPIASLFVIRVRTVFPILAPSYLLYPNETTEESQRIAARRAYGGSF